MTLRAIKSRLTIPHLSLLVTCLAMFGYLVFGYYDAQDMAARKLALRNDPPETVSIVEFEAARDVGLAREVSVRAQVDTSFAMRRPMILNGRRLQALVVPLLAPEPVAFAASDMIFGYAVIPLGRGEADAEALRRTLPQTDEEGRFGPVVTIAGQRLQHARLSGRIENRITTWGREAVRQGLMVMPFEGPRAVALAQMPRSHYRQLCLWAAIAAATSSLILLRAQSQIAADKRLSRIDRHKVGSTAARSRKAMTRFVPLIEQERLEGRGHEAEDSGWRARLIQLIPTRSG